MTDDDFLDIEEELLWEATQRKIIERVKEYEKIGWGYTNFKNYMIENYPNYNWDEDVLVEEYQIFLLQNNFKSVKDWARSIYG